MANECFEMEENDMFSTYFGLDPKRDLITALNLHRPHLLSDTIPGDIYMWIWRSPESLGYHSLHCEVLRASLSLYCYYTHLLCSALPLPKYPASISTRAAVGPGKTLPLTLSRTKISCISTRENKYPRGHTHHKPLLGVSFKAYSHSFPLFFPWDSVNHSCGVTKTGKIPNQSLNTFPRLYLLSHLSGFPYST